MKQSVKCGFIQYSNLYFLSTHERCSSLTAMSNSLDSLQPIHDSLCSHLLPNSVIDCGTLNNLIIKEVKHANIETQK